MSRSWPPPCTERGHGRARGGRPARRRRTGPPTLWPVSVSASTPRGGEVDRDRADRLHGVGVDRDAVGGRDRDDLVDRLQRADLVVGPHHRDQRHRVGVALDRRPQRVDVEPAALVDGQQLDLGALVLGEPVERVEHRVVLDRGREDPGAPRVGVAPGPVDALEGEVVGLGAAGGEDHLAGPAARAPARPSPATPRPPAARAARWRAASWRCRRRRGGSSSPRRPPAASAWWPRGRGRRGHAGEWSCSCPVQRTACPRPPRPPDHLADQRPEAAARLARLSSSCCWLTSGKETFFRSSGSVTLLQS